MVPHKMMLDLQKIICFKEISGDLAEKDLSNLHLSQITIKEIKEKDQLGNSVQCLNQGMIRSQVQVNINPPGLGPKWEALHLQMPPIMLQIAILEQGLINLR